MSIIKDSQYRVGHTLWGFGMTFVIAGLMPRGVWDFYILPLVGVIMGILNEKFQKHKGNAKEHVIDIIDFSLAGWAACTVFFDLDYSTRLAAIFGTLLYTWFIHMPSMEEWRK